MMTSAGWGFLGFCFICSHRLFVTAPLYFDLSRKDTYFEKIQRNNQAENEKIQTNNWPEIEKIQTNN